ncbi:Protein STAY-GREEN, chloroplastic-like [Salvia divinorum]|uniref:Protein STAY-GREEN, chloroplastic-like n=1 Tax=Salvia divinorum TaxID=28513 RepID=A0ABD1HL16_SALDI
MGSMAAALLLPSKSPFKDGKDAIFMHRTRRRGRKNQFSSPVARLFGPAIFEASKLKLTLAISHTINNSQLQGWYNKLQRDEVVAEWKKLKGKMSLHVHCHISGGHFLLDLFSTLRYYIFCKELPVVLKAFVHGDGDLFKNYPELEEALVWVYFHSNIPEFNKVECWGPLRGASGPSGGTLNDTLEPCQEDCTCCFQRAQVIAESPDASQTYMSGPGVLLESCSGWFKL